MANPKKRAKMLEKKRAARPQPVVAGDVSASEAALADLTARLLALETTDAQATAAGLAELRAWSAPIIAAALTRLAQEGGQRAMSLLEAALADETLALGAAQALAHVQDPAAAQLLADVSRTHPDRAVVKAARRSAYELRRAGIVWAAPAEEKPREEWPLYKAIVSHIDDQGSRALWVARRGVFGSLRVISLILNETLGIKDCAGVDDFGRVDFDRLLEEGPQSEPPLIFAEIGLPYARWLVEEARARNKESGFQLPLEFRAWRGVLGEAQPEDGRPLIAGLAPDVVRNHPEWLDEAKKLMDLPVCRYWLFAPQDMEPYLEHYTRNKARELEGKSAGITDLGAMGDEAIIVRRAVRELFDAKRLARMQRRLEETAILLWLIGQQDEARWAAATALTLAEGTPAEDVPFFYELVDLSLQRALALMLRDMDEHLTFVEPEEEDASGILLPRQAFAPPTPAPASGIFRPDEAFPSPTSPPVEDLPQTSGGIYLPR